MVTVSESDLGYNEGMWDPNSAIARFHLPPVRTGLTLFTLPLSGRIRILVCLAYIYVCRPTEPRHRTPTSVEPSFSVQNDNPKRRSPSPLVGPNWPPSVLTTVGFSRGSLQRNFCTSWIPRPLSHRLLRHIQVHPSFGTACISRSVRSAPSSLAANTA